MDPMWEFNAPQFVDFHNVNEDPKADEYFDMDHEAEDMDQGMPDIQESVNQHECDMSINDMADNKDGCTTEPAQFNLSTNDAAHVEDANDEDCETNNEGDTSKHSAHNDEGLNSPTIRRSSRKSNSATVIENSVSTPTVDNEGSSEDRVTSGGIKSLRSASNTKKSEMSGKKSRRSVRRSHSTAVSRDKSETSSMGGSGGRKLGLSAGKRPSLSKVQKIHTKLTMPSTPTWMKRYNPVGKSKVIKNSEVLEMEKIQELRKALVEKRKIAAESCSKALQPVKCPPATTELPLTEPQEFHFATDARLKDGGIGNVKRSSDSGFKEVDFVKELRKTSAAMTTTVPMKTIPQPFHLHSPKKRKSNADDKCETVAEKVAKFYSKTPDRFHSRRAGSHETSPAGRRRSCSEHKELHKRAIPKTPNLTTRARARATTVMSQADLEQLEVEDMKKNQFKARPLNEKILKQQFEIVKNPTKGKIKIEEFQLETEYRLRARKELEEKSHASEEAHAYEFHANPIPAGILEGPVGVKPAKEIPLTIPQSPAFASKMILRSSKPVKPPTPKDKRMLKSHAVPHMGLPFQPKFENRTTVVAPFSFDDKIQAAKLKKEEKIRELLEEEKKAREFHATELKDLEPVLPPKYVKPATNPQPFQFEAEKRAALKELHVSKNDAAQQQQHKFKARPADILKKAPYEPVKSTRSTTVLTEAMPFKLSTERRAEEREKWEKMNEEREAEAAMERMEREKREAEQEEQERRRMRSEAVHQAQPIRSYRPVHIQPSDKPLTVPETPAFSERLRSRDNLHH